MKHNVNTVILFFILVCLKNAPTFGQFSFFEEPYNMLESSFIKDKEEIDPQTSFFNVLKVVNPTDRRLRFEVSFGTPVGWVLMGERTQSVVLAPGETKLIPLRISANAYTMGDIGYTIVASLKDNTGKVFKNSYSFINVPKRSEIKYKLLERNLYFDQYLKNTTLSMKFSNTGNVNELIYVSINLPQTVTIEGAQDNSFKDDFILNSNKDTIVNYNVQLKNSIEAYEQQNHGLYVEAGSKDTLYKSTVWIKNLDSKYTLEIPETDRILVTELAFLNLFSEGNPIYEGAFWGSIHGKNSLLVDYFFRTMGEQFYKKDPLIYNYSYIKTIHRNWGFRLGDLNQPGMLTVNGKGGQIDFNHRRIRATASATKNFISDITGKAIIIKSKINRRLSLSAGYSQTKNKNYSQSKMPSVGAGFTLFKHYSLKFDLGYSITDNLIQNDNNQKKGFGGNALLQINYPRFRLNSRLMYGEPSFAGMQRGKMDWNSYFDLDLKNSRGVYGRHNGINQVLLSFNNSPQNIDKSISNHNVNILYYAPLTSQVSYSVGPWYNYLGSNSFYLFNPEHWFAVHTSMIDIIIRYRSNRTPINIGAEARVGASHISKYSTEYGGFNISNLNPEKTYLNMYISLYTNLRNWNFNAAYYHGPYTMVEHYSKFYNYLNPKTVRLIGGYRVLFFEKIFEYSVRGTYSYIIHAKTNRLGVSNELVARPGGNWTLSLSNSIGHQSTFDKLTENKYKYNNLYFEFRIRKEFGINQPKFKYLNLDLIFFKDLNGNGVRDPNEPGVSNVLVSIDKDWELTDSLLGKDRHGEFYTMEFLSDIDGHVRYKNIPDGYYTVNFTPVGKNIDSFVAESSQLRLHLKNSDIIEIPFQERNKIFGQIVMNRSKLSNLGTIDISNIKVTADDGKGKIYSTLTDKNGRFVIFVPNIEKYTVSINNIFREHFELEQNTFDVQLNGYKQFELSFIFTEKQRRINFAQQIDFSGEGQQIQAVKRTNLAGTVKDEATFAPIKANVKIIDQGTGNTIAETVTDGRSGNFYMSFVSGDNYHLDVTAEGYWFYSEGLMGEQISTFLNLNRDVMLTAITIGSKLTLHNVVFNRNESGLNEEARVELSKLLDVLNANPGIQIEIVGHCDDIEAINNVGVAESRAKEVMRFLVENGYTNVTSRTMGGSDPVINEATEEARRINRRVDAIVISK